MSKVAIRVDGISKRYWIGSAKGKAKYRTLRDVLASRFKSGFGLAGLARSRRRAADDRQRIVQALDGVSLEVTEGEVLGLIGRNGAGKSTLLKILSRITEPDAGSVEIYGRVASLLEVGTGFHAELTGRENVFLSGAILGMRRAEIRRLFDEIVAFAEVERFIDTPVKHYSSGMYLRLAFAVAAHLQPEILLVDEVLAVGDAAFQRKCIGKMSETAKNGRTVVFVSHNMAAVTQMCQRAAWLEQGRVHKVDLSEEIVKAYLSDGSSQVVERTWDGEDAPGDDRVLLRAVRVLQDDRLASVIDINEPAQIEFEFDVLKDVRNLITGIYVADATGVCLFLSRDWRPNRLGAGRYRKHVEIPGQVLAETRLTIDVGLAFYDPSSQPVAVANALVVDTVDSAHPLAVRGPFKGPWPGVLRVRLPWSEASPVENG